MVVATHFGQGDLPNFTQNFAVPCFFIIAGYYAYYPTSTDLAKCKNKIWRTLKILVIAFLIYVVYDVTKIIVQSIMGMPSDLGAYLTGLIYHDFLTAFFFYNEFITSGYHLWFLIALLTVYIVHYWCEKYLMTKHYPYLWVVLLLVSYLIDACLPVWGLGRCNTQNALFTGLPCFMIGYVLHRYQSKFAKLNRFVYLTMGLVCIILAYFECKLYNAVWDEYPVHFIMGFAANIFITQFFLICSTVNTDCWFYRVFGKNFTLWVYILHVMVGDLFCNVLKIWFKFVFVVVFLLTALLVLLLRYVVLGVKILCAKRRVAPANKIT